MVNFVELQKRLLKCLLKMAGIKPQTVEIEPGTVMTFWVPSEALNKPINAAAAVTTTTTTKPKKPVVVLIHGFAGDGILTWQFQIGSLTKNYSVYVPDLLFFGGSMSDSSDRLPRFQAECLMKGLKKLGVDKCTVVGFSYGGMVAFKMAELYPDMVGAMVASGSILAMTDSISEAMLKSLGFASLSELLLPTSVWGTNALLSVGAHKKLWFLDRLHRDFLRAMFTNRKERGELLDGLIVRNKDTTLPTFNQKIYLLWCEND